MKSTQPFAVQLEHINSICQAALAKPEPVVDRTSHVSHADQGARSHGNLIPPRHQNLIRPHLRNTGFGPYR